MAEDLHDGEFWLPSHFLTDDDILMDFTTTTATTTAHGGSSSSFSDLEFASAFTETESDEDDNNNSNNNNILLAELTHPISCPVHFKGRCSVLSSSPQSTLCGCVCNQSSSRESLSPPPQQPPQAEESVTTDANTTLDLLNKAAGEVARLKLRTEKKIGTGFFDCSQKGVSYPPPLKNPPLYFQPQFLHFPPMVWAPSNMVQFNPPKQQQQQQQNRATKGGNKSNTKNNNNNNNNNNNRPLGLPLSAWPPLQPQSQAQTQTQAQAQAQPQPKTQPQAQPQKTQPQAQPQPQPQPQLPFFVGPPKGTGVFLPRRVGVATPAANETRKKSDGNATKSKSGKGSQSQSNHRRNSIVKTSTTTIATTNHNDIQLPQEWTY